MAPWCHGPGSSSRHVGARIDATNVPAGRSSTTGWSKLPFGKLFAGWQVDQHSPARQLFGTQCHASLTHHKPRSTPAIHSSASQCLRQVHALIASSRSHESTAACPRPASPAIRTFSARKAHPQSRPHKTNMASPLSTAMRRLATSQLRQSATRATRLQPTCLRASARAYSTEPPPLLSKLKADLKTAMRAKDAPRLAVLRSVLAATTNAAKTDKPVATDLQLVQLLRKTRRGNEEAVEEALKAGRQDLVEKEEAQLRILDEYVAGSGLSFVEGDELRALVAREIEGMGEGQGQGQVIAALMRKDWAAEGKFVDKAALSRVASELLKGKKEGA